MGPNPILGLVFHWVGGLAAASFYLPYKRVRGWAWETYWLVGGAFSWVAAPAAFAAVLVPGFADAIFAVPGRTVGLTFFWGLVWGVGGLTFGLSVRYLGVALGYAIALGLCTALGTLVPPLYEGTLGTIAADRSGQVTLAGIGICLVGIVLSGMAGASKERELSAAQKAATVGEFHFLKGLAVATLAGRLSAAMAYGLAAGRPIADAARGRLLAAGRSDLWQNLPVLVVVLLGGFTTNAVWCLLLNVKNRTAGQYLGHPGGRRPGGGGAASDGAAPVAANYVLSAAAGLVWYLQFFFYSMGQTRMGRYEFSSWTLHMASIIVFSTLWGVALREWAGTSRRTKVLVGLGLAVLVLSTVVVGYGNALKPAGGHE